MTPSIRTFLLINLFLSVTLITSLAIIGNLVLSHKDIQKQLDTQLVHTALSIQALLSIELEESDINAIQNSLTLNRVQNPGPLTPPASLALPENTSTHDHNFFMEFQVWD